jgi:hypothetical protein
MGRKPTGSFPLLTGRGWKAVALLAALLGFLALKFYTVKTDLDAGLGEVVRTELQEAYAEIPPSPTAAAGDSTVERITAAGEEAPVADMIEIESIEARGRGSLVVRVVVRVNGNPPPDGREVRYFRVKRSNGHEWIVVDEAAWWSFYLSV